jgi:hypothetical protein
LHLLVKQCGAYRFGHVFSVYFIFILTRINDFRPLH